MVNALKGLDLIVVIILLVSLFILDRTRRKGLTDKERKDFEDLANDVAERNIAANVAARVIQGGFTVSGFLFGGLFASVFQPALQAYTSDIFIAILWVTVSLIAGVMNLAPLTPQSVVKNIAITTYFSTWSIVQFVTIIGAFIRVIVLVLQYLKFV